MNTNCTSIVPQPTTNTREARISTQLRIRPSRMQKIRRIADREGLYIGRVLEYAIDCLPDDESILHGN